MEHAACGLSANVCPDMQRGRYCSLLLYRQSHNDAAVLPYDTLRLEDTYPLPETIYSRRHAPKPMKYSACNMCTQGHGLGLMHASMPRQICMQASSYLPWNTQHAA
eukprot:1158747-Pelagomonas_calceolata.AAC.12